MFLRFRKTYRERHIHTHTDVDTHTQRPTHCLNTLDLTLHTEHLTHNSHSNFTRDEKCFFHSGPNAWAVAVAGERCRACTAKGWTVTQKRCLQEGGTIFGSYQGRLGLRSKPAEVTWSCRLCSLFYSSPHFSCQTKETLARSLSLEYRGCGAMHRRGCFCRPCAQRLKQTFGTQSEIAQVTTERGPASARL